MLIEIKPSNIHFSVAIIDNVFHRNSHHCYSRIGETLDSLCEGKIKIRDIPPISVIRYNSGWLTVNNRRLWVFRQMERLGKCARIPVVVVKEIAVLTYITEVKVTVRENPGGIWYLLPSCEMQDPFSTVIWDTAKHIKEFMHPPPSPRMIIKIFENLSQTRDNGKSVIIHEGNSYVGDTCSDLQTFSSGYVDVLNNNTFDQSEKEPMGKERRTEKWVSDHSGYITFAAQRNELCNEFISSQTLYELKEDVAESERLKLYHRSVPDCLAEHTSVSIAPDVDAVNTADQNSEASKLTSGFLVVMGDADNTYRDELILTNNAETKSVCYETEHYDKFGNNINLQSEVEPLNINEITNNITYKTQSVFLNKQKTDREKEFEFRAYIGDVLQSTVVKYKEKCQMYEREILTLKEETEKSVGVRQEAIETLKKQVTEILQNFQEVHRESECHETANQFQDRNATITKDKSNETNTEGEYCAYSCHSGDVCQLQDN